ncbi:hypothetical protein GWI72_09465 [Microvirga tunisiensis]|uniref:DUF6456 domain-containing protein n=1 Tax=Pannonibacter tanglangensis TaxID=2750084 RepID=A0A7X5J8B0_9HYPH|nr:DUF6456 domain-containing protein [Pannonibacter sp. XCT-53]NBN78494.1 hypothetical protein [Pannonibacter sp. XCT-53]
MTPPLPQLRRTLKWLAAGPLAPEAVTARLGDAAAAGDLIRHLLAEGLAARQAEGLTLSTAGRLHLRRLMSGADDPFRAQHQDRHPPGSGPTSGPDDGRDCGKDPGPASGSAAGAVRTAVNLSESPLAWLAQRRDSEGRPLLDRDQVEAGERLRLDFTRARLMPHLAGGWRTERVDGGAGAGHPAVEAGDQGLAARRRTESALAAVGPGLAPVLVDVCCHLKGLSTVERERGWPPRSAKVVLGLALTTLARHYGLGLAGIRPPARRGRPT